MVWEDSQQIPPGCGSARLPSQILLKIAPVMEFYEAKNFYQTKWKIRNIILLVDINIWVIFSSIVSFVYQ